MSSYAITLYSRDDLTFGRDKDGNFTVTVKEGATPDTIKIVDNDEGEAGETFSGSTGRGSNATEHSQEAYGEYNGTELGGVPIQPLAALPGYDDPGDQIMAIGIGDPVEAYAYGFTSEPTPGETMTYNYSAYDSAPSYASDSLYVEGETSDPSLSSGVNEDDGSDKEDGSGASGNDDDDDDEGGSGASGKGDDDEGGSGASGKGDDDEGGSGASGKGDDDEGGSGVSGKGDDDEGGSGSSGSSDASGGSGTSGASGEGGSSDSSSSSGSSGGSGSSGSGSSSGGSEPSGGSSPSGSGPSEPCCFTRGTAIRTARGEILVEDLVVQDMVWTEGHGLQPIRWICQQEVPAKGDFAPIRICKGTLGADRDLLVSPAHRMLVQGPEIEVLFGMSKALVAAKDLVNDTTILRETRLKTVEYFHIMFDQHEVLEAHGTLSESFFPHGFTVEDFEAEQRKELFALFPELEFGSHGYSIVYPGLLPHEVSLIVRQSS